MNNPELGLLHGDLANGLQNLIEQRRNESETDRIERELSNPNTSFIGALREAAQEVYWYKPNDVDAHIIRTDGSITEFESTIVHSSLYSASKSKWSEELFNEEGKLDAPGQDGWLFYQYAALSNARKYLKDDDPMIQARGLLIAARVAALNLPENFEGQKPKRHRQETVEDVLFRKAITVLREKQQYSTRATTDTLSEFLEQLNNIPDEELREKYYVASLIHPDNNQLRKGQTEVTMGVFADKILEILARPQTTPESIQEEQYKLARLRKLREEESEAEPEVVNWEILPPEALGEIERTGETSHEGSPDFVDPERLKWLARLAIDWGNDAYIVVSSLRDKNDTNKYYAAILPGLSNGTHIEHAVAENASSGNATYVFRAERGMNPDGSTWLTWRDVLKDTKSGARALGAKRILHGQFWDENVIEYLTRPDDDLENGRYKR